MQKTTSYKKNSRILMIVPTLGKRTDLLKKTLESIREQQSDVSLDLVMVYPLDNKQTVKLATEYNAISVADPGGISRALNAGIEQANGCHEFVTWLGDDDILTKHSLATTLSALKKNPDATVAYGYCDYINDSGKKILTSRAGNIAPWLMTWGPNLLPQPGILLRLSFLKQAGLFSDEYGYAMDLDMLLKMRKLGPFVNTKKILAAFRWHADSATVANREKSIAESQIIQRRNMSSEIVLLAPTWEIPVRIANRLAAKYINILASK